MLFLLFLYIKKVDPGDPQDLPQIKSKNYAFNFIMK
jgi:hypothetical protein